MELSQQVVSLDLAKRLKELGVKQESLFEWRFLPNGPEIVFVNNAFYDTEIAAFTVAELGKMLPKGCKSYRMNDIYENEVWGCDHPISTKTQEGMIANTEADARAAMLVYLLENKLITL